MTDQSGDLACPCLFLYLIVFVVPAYKRPGGCVVVSSLPSLSLPFNHYYQPYSIMSSPAYTSFPFSFKEDACAQDVVESMEQVGDLASLCLK